MVCTGLRLMEMRKYRWWRRGIELNEGVLFVSNVEPSLKYQGIGHSLKSDNPKELKDSGAAVQYVPLRNNPVQFY